MIKFSKEKVELLHQLIAQETGGSIGIRLECSDDDILEAGLGVASGKMNYEDLLDWVKNHEAMR